MGNETSQEGEGGATDERPAPQLVSQQSMPLPAQASEPPKLATMGRRGSAGPQLMARRPSGSGLPPVGGPQLSEKRASIIEIPVVEMPDVDMTNLTEEEQMVIRSVMARAKSIEEDPHPPPPTKEEEETETEKCALCRSQPKECACVECGAQTCKKCSKAIPSGKKHVWMCGPCSERYPHLAPNVSSRRETENNSVAPADGRRRTSECPIPSNDDRRQKMGPQEGAPPQRGRSDSLPAQPPRQMQQQQQHRPHQPQNAQMRQDPSQPRPMHPNNGTQMRGVRPDHPQQGPQMRQQQPRPRYPVDQQRPQQPRDQRPQHPMDQRAQHPRDQRPQHPMDQRPQHPMDQRPPHPMDQRPPHPMDQRPPHPMDQRPPHPIDQRPPHPMEQRPPHPMDQRPPHPMEQRPQQPMDPRAPHPMEQRPPHPPDQRTPHSTDHRHPHPMDPRSQHPIDQKHSNDSPRRQHPEDQHSQITNEMQQQQKVSNRPVDPRSQQTPEQRQHIIEQQRHQHSDQTRHNHPPDQTIQPLTEQSLRNQNSRDPHSKRSENLSDLQKVPSQKPQGPNGLSNSPSRAPHPIENGPDFPPAKTYYPNDQPKPKPQHPIVHPQNRSQHGSESITSYSPQDSPQEYPPQIPLNSLDSNQIIPPQRNQRLREPPEQQVIPKPQHPQEPPQEFHQRHVVDNQYSPEKHRDHQHHNNKNQQSPFKVMNDQSGKIQNSRSNGCQPIQQQMVDNQQRIHDESSRHMVTTQGHPSNSPEILHSNKSPQPQQRQQHNQQRNQNEPERQTVTQVSNKHGMVDLESNDVYVSLSDHKPMKGNVPFSDSLSNEGEPHVPPATLPRTKRPEVPQPAGRTNKREKSSPNQTLPRTGTNPFRTDTNPFRRESLPQEILDAGEYVTVAPRRGSLDERFRHMSNQDQVRLAEAIQAGEVNVRPAAERRLEPQNSFEKHKNGSSEESQNSNRYLDEEQRRNAINSGVCPPDPNSRRQLPNIDPQKRSHPPQYVEQGVSPPVPKTRTSISDSAMYSEGRNGIPRTVPLTSLAQTLEQQSDSRMGVCRPQEGFGDNFSTKTEKNLINDLSQHKQVSGPHGHMSQEQKRKEDYVQPNIVETNTTSTSGRNDYPRKNGDGTTKAKLPPNQTRHKSDRSKEQPPYPPQVDRMNTYPEQSEEQAWRDSRRGKPLPPESNAQDLEGYQDEEEEQNIDDYFEMIEKAISRPQQQTIVGGKRSSEIQRQLLNQDVDGNHPIPSGSDYPPQKGQVSSVLRQIDAFGQNQGHQVKGISPGKQHPTTYDHRNDNIKEKNDLNMYDQDKVLSSKKDFYEMDDDEFGRRDKKDQQYIIQPTDQRYNAQQSSDEYSKQKKDHNGKPYDKLLLHELTPDTRQPPANHYLEEHKTQPLSYEAFSSVKALQQIQPDPRQEQQSQKPYTGGRENETRNQTAPYYHPQQTSGSYYQSSGQNNNIVTDPAKNGQQSNGSKSPANDAQNQKKAKPKPDPQDWSPVSDLSPIIDVSPSVEAAEQELMEKFQEKIVIEDDDEDMLDEEDPRLLKAGGIPRATSGTISGMLEEFNRALGLPGTSPVDDSGIKSAVSPTSLAISPISNMSASMTSVSTIQKEYQESFGSPQKSAPGGSPQKTPAQPTTPRRSHRRLPQPTVEQMQAAVAMAAQGPREKSPQPPSTTGQILFGVDPKPVESGHPNSPSMSWKTTEINQSFEQAYNNQHNSTQPLLDSQSNVPSPAPRGQSRSSASNGQKVGESVQPVPTVMLQDVPTPQVRRLRSSSYGGSTSPKPTEELMARLNGGGSSSPHGGILDMVTTTVGSPQTPSTPRDKTGDSSDTQSEAESIKSVRLRRKLPNLPPDQCASPSPTRKTIDRARNGNGFQDHTEAETPNLTPASALTVTTTVLTGIESSKEFSTVHTLGAPSPTPGSDRLSPLMGRRMDTSRTPSPGGDVSGIKLPQYMQSLKQQLRDELKAVTEERKVMLEQRGKEGGESDSRSHTPQPPFSAHQSTPDYAHTPSTSVGGTTPTVPRSLPSSTNTAAISAALMKQIQGQNPYQVQSVSQSLPQSQTVTPITCQPQKSQVSAYSTPTNQTPSSMPYGYKMPTQPQYQSQPQLLQYQNQPQLVQYQTQPQALQYHTQPQTPLKGHLSSHYGSSQELHLYQSLMDSGRRTPQPSPAKTPLPDAIPKYAVTHRPTDDDITIMTTATTTVVSASEQWHDGKRHRLPPTTTMAPSSSFVGTVSVESLRRLQQKMTPQPSLKKGRRRHTSEITVPPFAQMEQAIHYQTMRQQQQQQQQPPPQYVQYYPKQIQQQQPVYRSMDFPSIDSHARATDLLRSSSARFGGSLGSGFGSTEALYQGRKVLNNRLQDYYGQQDNRMMMEQQQQLQQQQQQQRVVGPDAYFQTLNNEINRLRRSSENIHRDAIYDKPTWDGQSGQLQAAVPDIRLSPQTTDRRKRKEKKSRKPRSWHPSPYVSEDEDDQMTREEKKAKIKAEIARRRQQIEENMRLHDELCKLAERRDRLETGRTTPVAYVPSPTGSIAYHTQEQQPMRPSSRMSDSDDTSSVLKAIDEILRKDLYDRPLSRTGWSNSYNPADTRQTDYYHSGYVTMPRNRYEYGVPVDARAGGAWYEEEQRQLHQQQQQQQQQQQYFQETAADPESAMDESMARIASTFPTDEPPDILLSSTPGHFSPEVTPAMPLLPDMPTRSRKLLENLGSSPIQPSRSGSVQSLYQDQDETNDDDTMGQRLQDSSTLLRSQRKVARTPVSKTSQKYDFPVKRILLTRDPKDRSVSGNGLGMKVVGGKEVPGSNGMIGAYVAKIFPGGVVETLGEVKEGDQVLEWNGIPLTGRTYEEVQRIIASSADEVEIVIRCDLNMLETLNRQRRSPGMGISGGPRGGGLEPPDTPGSGGPGRGGSPHSPYSPAGSSRGHSPALTKRTMAGGGGGGNMGNSIHNALIGNNINHAASYEHIQSTENHDSGFSRSYGRALISGNQTSRSVMNVFAPGSVASDWPELYEPSFFSSPPSPDDFIEDEFQSRWQRESRLEQVQFQVCCGPRTAIVYVPIMPARPMLKSAPSAILNRNHFARRSVDHIDEYEPLLKNGWSTTNDTALGFYDLLRPRTSLGKVSLYLNSLKEKAEVYEHLRRTNGVCRVSEEREEEPRERPRAPSDLPGLRPVFVNDWKRPKQVYFKAKMEENDDNNNTTKSNCNQTGIEKARKPHVGSSPEVSTPYNILPKGCRGSFCVIL